MRRLITLMAITGLVAGMVAVPVTATSDDGCYGVRSVDPVVTTFDTEVFGFTGGGTFRVGGKEVHVGATAFPSPDPPEALPNGWLVAEGGRHILDFYFEGLTAAPTTVETTDKVIMVPTDTPGFFNLRTRLTLTTGESGTGGSGKLHLLPSSTIDLSTINQGQGEAQWEMRGHICFGSDA